MCSESSDRPLRIVTICFGMLAVSRYALRRAREDHRDVQRRLGAARLVMAPQSAASICQEWDLAVIIIIIIIIIIRTRSRQRTVAFSILHDHQSLSRPGRPLVQWAVRPWEHHAASCFVVSLAFLSNHGMMSVMWCGRHRRAVQQTFAGHRALVRLLAG